MFDISKTDNVTNLHFTGELQGVETMGFTSVNHTFVGSMPILKRHNFDCRSGRRHLVLQALCCSDAQLHQSRCGRAGQISRVQSGQAGRAVGVAGDGSGAVGYIRFGCVKSGGSGRRIMLVVLAGGGRWWPVV